MRLIRLHDCDSCGSVEERIFTDSWSGRELCPACLHAIVGQLALSPASDGDNLNKLLKGMK